MTTISDAVKDLFNNQQLPAEEAADRHYAPSFRQRINGSWDDRAGFLARVIDLRKVIEHATITVFDELADGSRYAKRHLIDSVQRDGNQIVQEVFLFATRDPDGRFVQIEEMTLKVQNE